MSGKRQSEKKAASVTHVEYAVLETLKNEVDLTDIHNVLAVDKVSKERFDKGATNILNLIQNMMDRRTHKLPKDHVDYKEKGE
tara:strand:- start:637 stop:885 length:249 start_codon:yes stop_codon:yes gene_type:complete